MYPWPPHLQHLGDVVKDYIDSGKPLSISDHAGVLKELEDEFAQIHGRKYALAVSSGTMALCSAYFALGIQPGDEIICTSISFHATVSPARLWGAKIIFCDTEADTGNIDVTKIEKLITPKTKAIATNDQWGHPCDKEKILEICHKYNVKYIEDCSHAHFSQYKGKYSGTFGTISCWSFQGRKLLSGGEGGMLMTDDFSLYERAVLLGHYSWRSIRTVQSPCYKDIAGTGFGLKLRMHPLAAVILLYELRHCYKDWVQKRHETLRYFEKRLTERTPLLPMAKREYVTSMGAWYGFYPRYDFEKNHINRDDFVDYLRRNGVEAKSPKDKLLPYLPLFSTDEFGSIPNSANYKKDGYPAAEHYMSSIVGFPTFTFHEYEEIDRYVDCISEYFRLHKR